MSHWLVAPIILPLLLAAALLVLAPARSLERALSLAGTTALVAVALLLTALSADGAHRVYAVGDWPAPFGIVLVLDRAAALMLAVTSLLALAAAAAAARGWDARGRHFHALLHFQLAGLNGAFLTGDLFNLFVFFEVLLIASYCLLLHGLGVERLRAGLHYVVVNLAASALFLIGVATLYGVTGTLNMADLGARLERLPEADAPLARAAALILLVVFAVKAAIFPLYFWLPAAYPAASAPVAALFAVMTKVGMYAIVRLYPLLFGEQAGALLEGPLVPLAVATLAAASLGALAAGRLATLTAYLTIVSAGSTLAAVALFGRAGIAAGLYYMVHSTLALGALFLLAGLVGAQRGADEDRLAPGPALAQPGILGFLVLLAAVNIAGLPPLSGFIGKVLILRSVAGDAVPWIWSAILASSFLGLVALARMGSMLFWNASPAPARGPRFGAADLAPAAFLLGCSVALAAFAAPVHSFTEAAAAQLLDAGAYRAGVLK